MFDVMAWFSRDVILGKIEIPSKEEREADQKLWVADSLTKVTGPENINFQAAHMKDIMAKTDYPEFNLDGMAELLITWYQTKPKDIMAYRDHAHASMCGGGHGVAQNKKWYENFDDSMESYVQN